MTLVEKPPAALPKAFLSYCSDDRALAQCIAEGLQRNGVETWWAEWEIRPGDSLRQKIDEGLSSCTHFIVLLTQNSVARPWVNQEMDAGLVRKIRDRSRFIPLRHNLPADALPPLLSGMLSPNFDEAESSIRQLVHDIHGVSQKPPLGPAPSIAKQSSSDYSPAAIAVAGVFVKRTTNATFADPQLPITDLTPMTGLSEEDVRDAVYELSGMLKKNRSHVYPVAELFANFDKFWMAWDPSEDARQLAADLINIPDFPHEPAAIAVRYEWSPRRLNPAIAYLENCGAINVIKALGMAPFGAAFISPTDATRRFVRSRS